MHKLSNLIILMVVMVSLSTANEDEGLEDPHPFMDLELLTSDAPDVPPFNQGNSRKGSDGGVKKHQYGQHVEYTYEMSDRTEGKPKIHMKFKKTGPNGVSEFDVPNFRKYSTSETYDHKPAFSFDEKPIQLSAPTFSGWLPFNEKFNHPDSYGREQEDEESSREENQPSSFHDEMESFVRQQSERLLKSLIDEFPTHFDNNFQDEFLETRYPHQPTHRVNQPKTPETLQKKKITSWDLV